MKVEVDKSSGVCRVAIEDEMTIYTALAMKNDLIEQLTQHDELEISLEGVTDIDSAGVQVMLLLKKEQQQAKKVLHFVKHSQPVIDVLETLNLLAHFGDPIVISGREG